MKQAFIYTFKVWVAALLTTVLAFAFNLVANTAHSELQRKDYVDTYNIHLDVLILPWIIAFAVVFPSVALFINRHLSDNKKKWGITALTLIGFAGLYFLCRWITPADIKATRTIIDFIPNPILIIGFIWTGNLPAVSNKQYV